MIVGWIQSFVLMKELHIEVLISPRAWDDFDHIIWIWRLRGVIEVGDVASTRIYDRPLECYIACYLGVKYRLKYCRYCTIEGASWISTQNLLFTISKGLLDKVDVHWLVSELWYSTQVSRLLAKVSTFRDLQNKTINI